MTDLTIKQFKQILKQQMKKTIETISANLDDFNGDYKVFISLHIEYLKALTSTYKSMGKKRTTKTNSEKFNRNNGLLVRSYSAIHKKVLIKSKNQPNQKNYLVRNSFLTTVVITSLLCVSYHCVII